MDEVPDQKVANLFIFFVWPPNLWCYDLRWNTMVYPLLELADTLNNLILDDKMNVRLKKNSENVTP